MLFDDAKLNLIVELSKFLCNNLTKKLIIAIMVARAIADLNGIFKQLISLKFLKISAHGGCADVLDHHSRGAHQPTATSTAAPIWAAIYILPPY